jgi:hypothetical protein
MPDAGPHPRRTARRCAGAEPSKPTITGTFIAHLPAPPRPEHAGQERPRIQRSLSSHPITKDDTPVSEIDDDTGLPAPTIGRPQRSPHVHSLPRHGTADSRPPWQPAGSTGCRQPTTAQLCCRPPATPDGHHATMSWKEDVAPGAPPPLPSAGTSGSWPMIQPPGVHEAGPRPANCPPGRSPGVIDLVGRSSGISPGLRRRTSALDTRPPPGARRWNLERSVVA